LRISASSGFGNFSSKLKQPSPFRRANAALRAATFDESLLYFVQLIISERDAFDRFDRATCDLRYRHQTTINDRAIDHDAARAALAFAAAFFGSGQMKLFAQHIEQALHGKAMERLQLAVNSAVDRGLFWRLEHSRLRSA